MSFYDKCALIILFSLRFHNTFFILLIQIIDKRNLLRNKAKFIDNYNRNRQSELILTKRCVKTPCIFME